jgi:hypothetical protein
LINDDKVSENMMHRVRSILSTQPQSGERPVWNFASIFHDGVLGAEFKTAVKLAYTALRDAQYLSTIVCLTLRVGLLLKTNEK